MYNVDLIRRHVLRYVAGSLRIYISSLAPLELDALRALQVDSVKTGARIADFVLQELGHDAPEVINGDSPTLKAARKVMPDKR